MHVNIQQNGTRICWGFFILLFLKASWGLAKWVYFFFPAGAARSLVLNGVNGRSRRSLFQGGPYATMVACISAHQAY